MSLLDTLTTQVAKNESVEASALLLINGIAARLAAAAGKPAAVTALAANLTASSGVLAAAVVANTKSA
jgi:hypothetical protein